MQLSEKAGGATFLQIRFPLNIHLFFHFESCVTAILFFPFSLSLFFTRARRGEDLNLVLRGTVHYRNSSLGIACRRRSLEPKKQKCTLCHIVADLCHTLMNSCWWHLIVVVCHV